MSQFPSPLLACAAVGGHVESSPPYREDRTMSDSTSKATDAPAKPAEDVTEESQESAPLTEAELLAVSGGEQINTSRSNIRH